MVKILIRLALIVLFATSAFAQTGDDARVHFEQGKTFAAAGKYAEAYKEFEAGYQASPLPAFLFNMGEAARGMGDTVKARAAYERFLAVESTGALADTARNRLAELGPAAPVVAPKPATVPTPAETAAHVEAKQANQPVVMKTTESKPIWKKWPFWAAVAGGAVVTTVFIVAVASSGDDGVTCKAGCVDLR